MQGVHVEVPSCLFWSPLPDSFISKVISALDLHDCIEVEFWNIFVVSVRIFRFAVVGDDRRSYKWSTDMSHSLLIFDRTEVSFFD